MPVITGSPMSKKNCLPLPLLFVPLVFLFCFPTGVVGGLPAEESVEKKIRLYSSKDAIVSNSIGRAANQANKNYGELYYISAATWTAKGRPYTERAFIHFHLAAIPAHAVISRAELTLYGIGHEPHTASTIRHLRTNTAYLERVISTWEEHGVTWYNQPASTPADRITLEASTEHHQNYSIDITPFVRGWVRGTYENHGLILRLKKEEYYARMKFASRDNLSIAKFPTLEITYRLPQSK